MILVIDNYDSFTYNIVQGLGALGAEIEVVRNDEIDVAGIAAKAPQAILFSPGPGNPDSAGVTLEAVKAFAGRCRSSGYAWATSLSPMRSERGSSAQKGSCTARRAA